MDRAGKQKTHDIAGRLGKIHCKRWLELLYVLFFIFLSPRFFSSLHFSIVFFLSAVCPVDVYCRLTSRPYCGIHTLAIRVRDDSLCRDLLYWSSSSLDAFYLRSRFFFLLLLLVIAAYNETHRKRKKKDGQLCISSGFLSVVRALLLFRFRRKQS